MFSENFLKQVAKKEKVNINFLKKQIQKGRVVVPLNNKKELANPVAIGEGLKVKINTNLGLSTKEVNIETEIRKMHCAIQYGTDTIMDLSVGDNLVRLRKLLLQQSSVPIGTVPIYEAACEVERKKGAMEKIKFDDIWEILKIQAEEGVDFFTIHAGILRDTVKKIQAKKRICGIVSRGGAIMARWMLVNKKENFFYENFDKILHLAKEYNITISLGDALRPGAISDSTDFAQLSELRVLGKLAKMCQKEGVQVMVEGPGHIRLDEIALNMRLEKKLCARAPFYVLGPLPIDIAAGYDHITSAIGGAIAAFHGADFLCVVTPAEHLRHPTVDDIKEGVIASRIAAHCINVLRFKDEQNRDNEISRYRAQRAWDKLFPLAIDEKKARAYRKKLDFSEDICTMCGNFCSLRIAEKCNLLK
jgi:phosphomethylpyrimidine synthase